MPTATADDVVSSAGDDTDGFSPKLSDECIHADESLSVAESVHSDGEDDRENCDWHGSDNADASCGGAASVEEEPADED
eukprot:572453-Pleurochrysis_carterae.AAC.1